MEKLNVFALANWIAKRKKLSPKEKEKLIYKLKKEHGVK